MADILDLERRLIDQISLTGYYPLTGSEQWSSFDVILQTLEERHTTWTNGRITDELLGLHVQMKMHMLMGTPERIRDLISRTSLFLNLELNIHERRKKYIISLIIIFIVADTNCFLS